MTSSRYWLARLLQIFGYSPKNHRLADAASEMHLLREAEVQLGAGIWENVESIEALSMEYWNLRKFIKAKEIIQEKVALRQAELNLAHEQRASVLGSTPEIHQELTDVRNELLRILEQLAQRRDEIIAEAREIRRNYDGLKMKLEVITKEAASTGSKLESLDPVKSRLAELKVQFSELKQQRTQIATEIEAGGLKVDHVDTQLNAKKKDQRLYASEAFQVISEGNKEISVLRAEIGLLDSQMRQRYSEIGRFVSYHIHDPACVKALVSQHGLAEVMVALRHSIVLNQRLGGRA